MPFFDPATETITWDGKTWSITNNRLFRARFEKYLAARESEIKEDAEYRAALEEVLAALSPKRSGGPSLPKAIAALTKASQYPIDAGLSDSIVNTVYGVWLARNSARAMEEANKELYRERKRLAHNMEVVSSGSKLNDRDRRSRSARRNQNGNGNNRNSGGSATLNNNGGSITFEDGGGAGNGGGGAGTPDGMLDASEDLRNEALATSYGRVGMYVKRIAEIEVMSTANRAKAGLSEAKSKLEFQGLILQLLVQRRFEHVVIGTRLYRKLFGDGEGDLKIKPGSQVERVFARGIGINPTLSTVDAIASEAMREVAEGVESFNFFVERQDLEAASKRLSEAFMVGEYLPSMRTLPRKKKVLVLDFVRDSNKLISALEARDFNLAEELTKKLEKEAKDFDASKARAAIESARNIAGMHLQKARNSAIAGNHDAVAEELQKAAEIWPNNPELKRVSDLIFERGDAHSRVLDDLDSLIAQKNYRQIYLDQAKYVAASLGKKDYEDKLKTIIEDMTRVRMMLEQAKGLSSKGDKHGAWEIVENLRTEFPKDNEVAGMSATLTGEVAEFVTWLKKAKQLEDRRKLGPALAYYLKAKATYPVSSFVEKGVDRIVKETFPGNYDEDEQDEVIPVKQTPLPDAVGTENAAPSSS